MPIIRSLNWPTVDDIIRSETATTMYNSSNGLVPEYLSNLFRKKSTQNVRKLRNTDTNLSLTLRKTNNVGRGLFLFVNLSFGINLNSMPNRHLPLAPLREESKTDYDDHSYFAVSIFLFVNVLATAPWKAVLTEWWISKYENEWKWKLKSPFNRISGIKMSENVTQPRLFWNKATFTNRAAMHDGCPAQWPLNIALMVKLSWITTFVGQDQRQRIFIRISFVLPACRLSARLLPLVLFVNLHRS